MAKDSVTPGTGPVKPVPQSLVPWSVLAVYIGTFVVFAVLTVFFVLSAISRNNHNLCPLLDDLHSAGSSSSQQPSSSYGKKLESAITLTWRKYGCT
jgi:hypothetical protein